VATKLVLSVNPVLAIVAGVAVRLVVGWSTA
jgi:hypothetical protein